MNVFLIFLKNLILIVFFIFLFFLGIVQHRLALYPVVQNLSSSSISSTNSGQGQSQGQIYPSTTWPIRLDRLGPTPFKSQFPSLPPKPPVSKQNSVPVSGHNFNARPADLPDLRRINSSEKIVSNNNNNFERDKRVLLRKYSQPEVGQGGGGKIFGSLDSLREVANGISSGGSEMLIKMIGSQDDDLSPRSSDGKFELYLIFIKFLVSKFQNGVGNIGYE